MSSSRLTNDQISALVNNLSTLAPSLSVNVSGTTYNATQIVSVAKQVIAGRTAIATAKGQVTAARTSSALLEQQSISVLGAARSMLVAMLGNDAAAMATLAVAPRKAPKALDTEQRVAATEKLRATRTARGTLGKKQKAMIKGNVTGVTVTSITAPGPVSPSSAAPVGAGGATPASPAPAQPTTAASAASVAPGTPAH